MLQFTVLLDIVSCCIQEADAVVSVLGEMDAWIICPFFLQGGRYTIEDIHYVADSDMYVWPSSYMKRSTLSYRSAY